MKNGINKTVLFFFILMIETQLFSQDIRVSEELTLYKLSEHCYIHTQDNNNGLVYINNNEAIIVSTPESEKETQNLINWVRNDKKARIIGFIIDRWHPDAMAGLDIVHKNRIKSYSFELTRQIAKEKGLPIPEIGFNSKLELLVGKGRIVCHFIGESHTKDGIVVWIPNEQILFGGNGIRNYNGWVGNIADANLPEWSRTTERIKEEYGNAKIVIPGHGNHGGAELIDYTINLYSNKRNNWIFTNNTSTNRTNFEKNQDISVISEFDSAKAENRVLTNAIVLVQDSTKYVRIESSEIIYLPEENQFNSDSGYLEIYDKSSQDDIFRIGVFYKQLIVFKIDDSVGLRIILKEFDKKQ